MVGPMIKILFFGDIVGRPGRTAVKRFLEEKKDEIRPDLVIADADNLASGRGPTADKCREMLDAGVDVLTCGDHIWDQKEAFEVLSKGNSQLLRPHNYPKACPGKGWKELKVKGQDVLVANFIGRIWTVEGLDSPFTIVDELLEGRKEKIIIVDFHAEATSEQQAFGRYLDGRVSAVLGTHTHVQTADEEILPGGTAYISDVGFCGPHDSVIGIKPESSIKRFKTALPLEFELAEGPSHINAVVVEVDERTGHALKIERVQELYD